MNASRPEDTQDDNPPLEPSGFGETLILGPTIDSRLAEGRQAFERHDYFGCVRILSRIPEPLRSEETRRLRERAAIAAEELNRIQADVKQALKAHVYDGLLPKLERYRELRPGDAKYEHLAAQLQEREASLGGPAAGPDERPGLPEKASKARRALKGDPAELLRYLQVGAFAGGVLGALIGGFWKPEGYVVGGVIGGALAAVNEWLAER